MHASRRRFLATSTSAAASSLGFGDLVGLGRLVDVRADNRPATPPGRAKDEFDVVRLARRIEETPRDRTVAMMVEELGRGLSYDQFVTAMLLAVVEMNVSPHHVYLIDSARMLGRAMPRGERLLPLFSALDTLQHEPEDGPRYEPVELRKVSAENAVRELHAGMERFDSERAESALAALGEAVGPREAMAELWRYAARDWTSIGHRAIAIGNAMNVLAAIGWEHAPAVYRFVVRSLNVGRARHAQHAANLERSRRVGTLPPKWTAGPADRAATLELLTTIRTGRGEDAAKLAFEQLGRGVRATSLWDAISLAGAEFMVNFPNANYIRRLPLHTNTSSQALRIAFDASPDAPTKLYVLLQAVAWVATFREVRKGNPQRDMPITELEPAAIPASAEEAVAAIFDRQPRHAYDPTRSTYVNGIRGSRRDMDTASRMVFAYAMREKDHTAFLRTARLITATKATYEAHDIKFPASMLDSYTRISPEWRPHLLAGTMHHLQSANMDDNPAVKQARELLG